MRRFLLLSALLPLLAGGCVARAAWDVATLPVKAVGKTVDVMTTSESERDAKWVRQQRKAEEARAREAREADRDARPRD